MYNHIVGVIRSWQSQLRVKQKRTKVGIQLWLSRALVFRSLSSFKGLVTSPRVATAPFSFFWGRNPHLVTQDPKNFRRLPCCCNCSDSVHWWCSANVRYNCSVRCCCSLLRWIWLWINLKNSFCWGMPPDAWICNILLPSYSMRFVSAENQLSLSMPRASSHL